MYGIEFLKRKLTQKTLRVKARYNYYEMKNGIEHVGKLLPPEYQSMAQCLGWCGKAVDSIADRLDFDGFAGDSFSLGEIFRLNNADIFYDSAMLSALISSCSFIYISRGEGGYPALQVIDGANATGIIDDTTNLLTEGYAVLKRDQLGKPILEAYFQPHFVEYYVNGKLDESLTLYHKAPYALLVPVINRPDAHRPFGHSRISRACMKITQSALRTLLRSEVSAEFYSFPQKYVLGLSDEAEFNNRAATYSSFLSFQKDSDGDKPTVGQFTQQSMAPFMEQMRTLASVFAGETGLTLDDLGFASSNPSSSEAIRASHENLRLTARKAQKTFGTGFLNAGYLAACLRDNWAYDRKAFADVKTVWSPVFEPDAAALAGIADAVNKIEQSLPGFLGAQEIRQLTGIKGNIS